MNEKNGIIRVSRFHQVNNEKKTIRRMTSGASYPVYLPTAVFTTAHNAQVTPHTDATTINSLSTVSSYSQQH